MTIRSILYALLLLPMVVLAVFSCSEDRVTDIGLTNLKQITDLVKVDDIGRTAFPRIWIDTVSRLEQYAKVADAMAPINPLDYWIETVAYGCTVTIVDSCAPDEFNEADSCAEIALETGARAKTYIVNILDTIVCRYNIVARSDSSITVKTVKYKEIQTALAAKLEKNETSYGGWRIFAIGRQRHGFGYTQSSFPAIDSIVLQSRSRDEVRVVHYPNQRIRYTAMSNLPTLYAGEPLRVTAYTRARFSNPPIEDAYIHYSGNGIMYHEWMGGDVSTNPDRQVFEWDIYESSGQPTASYSQIAVELLQRASLRDDGANQFANMIWAFTYRME